MAIRCGLGKNKRRSPITVESRTSFARYSMALKTYLEIPLALLSFGFYKINKFIIGNLYTLYLSRNQKNAKQWRIISADLLKKPLSLSVLMTKAPRWNTHATIGTLGPITVTKELTINLETIRTSTRSWVGCIYDFPSYKTVFDFTPLTDDPQQSLLTIPLPPGKYTVGLRYYEPKENMVFPQVITDQNLEISPLEISNTINDFYQTLAEQTNLYFSCLHYYVFTILQLRKMLPEGFVQYEFLPVGATDTQFFYGALYPDESLQIDIDPEWRSPFDFYLTLYNRASFPLGWQKLTTDTHIPPLKVEGYYLIRMRAKSPEAERQIPHISGQEEQVNPQQKRLYIHSKCQS